jgi:hypothetical protein
MPNKSVEQELLLKTCFVIESKIYKDKWLW